MKTQSVIKHELQQLISSIGSEKQSNPLFAAAHFLIKSNSTSNTFKYKKQSKEEEIEGLVPFLKSHTSSSDKIDFNFYITEGAEQKVYLSKDGTHVYKLNDSIFYTCWYDYFVNLILHNYFFPATKYELIDIVELENIFYVIVKQVYVESTEPTEIKKIKDFMEDAGFKNKKNNDYYNPNLGVILEDLHEQNVLTNSGILFFIDTVFYVTDDFKQVF